MEKLFFKNPRFIKTAILPKDYPDPMNCHGRVLPEIAVAGRSNVGKSTLLNHLFQSKGLVKTSSTPGKTQNLNFFILNEQLSFVDLPGYGYAKVPLSVRKRWGPMVQAYFDTRDALSLLLLLFDIRRVPNQEDFQMLDWATYNEVPFILVLTKVDKVKSNEKAANTAKILKAFGDEDLLYLHYSATKNVGRDRLIGEICKVLEERGGTKDG